MSHLKNIECGCLLLTAGNMLHFYHVKDTSMHWSWIIKNNILIRIFAGIIADTKQKTIHDHIDTYFWYTYTYTGTNLMVVMYFR